MKLLENNSRLNGFIVTIFVSSLGAMSGVVGTADAAKPVANSSVIVHAGWATGLNNPRGLKFGPDGNLYVAEGGVGGTDSTAGPPALCQQAADRLF